MVGRSIVAGELIGLALEVRTQRIEAAAVVEIPRTRPPFREPLFIKSVSLEALDDGLLA